MRERDQLVIAGGLALLALALLRRGGGDARDDQVGGAPLDPNILGMVSGWRFPVETLDVQRYPEYRDTAERLRMATISDGWRWRDTGKHHDGVDLMFKRSRWERVKLPDRSEWHDMPAGIRAVATMTGKVSVSRDVETGGFVKIWHPGNLATQYLHLERRFVAPGDVVKPGQPIGLVGFDPSGFKLRHLHFELLVGGQTPIDPEPYMRGWLHTTIPETVS